MQNTIGWNATKELKNAFVIKVSGGQEMTLRYKLAGWLLKLAATIAKVNIELV